jgi:HlyD family secretion protein
MNAAEHQNVVDAESRFGGPRLGHILRRSGLRRWKLLLAFALAVAIAIGVTWRVVERPTAVNYVTAPVTRGSIARTVSATGTVNPVLTIIVGSYVSGVISEMHCDYNTKVKKGQVCARIDARPYKAALEQA